jgi:2-dehydropantoate 2-reductase
LAARLNWLIFGAGAIGTYVGASLILHGQNVVFIEQAETTLYLKEHGLSFNILGQEHRILHPDVYSSLPQVLTLADFDIAILAIKSYDSPTAIEGLRPYIVSLPPFLCLQNGVENELALERLLGKDKVIAGTVTSSVLRRGPGDCVLERQRGIGVASGHRMSHQIAAILSDAGLNARLYPSPLAMKWSKMLTNLLANASCAILDMTPAEVLRHPGLYHVEIAQLREALAVMHALGLHPVDLPGVPVAAFSWAVQHLPDFLSQPLISRIAGQGRGQKMPSFHIDLHAGHTKSEVDYLNGAVVRAGARVQIPTPINQWLNKTLLSLVNADQPVDLYTHQPIRFLDALSSMVENHEDDQLIVP